MFLLRGRQSVVCCSQRVYLKGSWHHRIHIVQGNAIFLGSWLLIISLFLVQFFLLSFISAMTTADQGFGSRISVSIGKETVTPLPSVGEPQCYQGNNIWNVWKRPGISWKLTQSFRNLAPLHSINQKIQIFEVICSDIQKKTKQKIIHYSYLG